MTPDVPSSGPLPLLRPDWPAPANVAAVSTTRGGGSSTTPFHSLNLGLNCGDDPEVVHRNRRTLVQALDLPQQPLWLNQVHGVEVTEYGPTSDTLDSSGVLPPTADACVSTTAGLACAILTADCLPVLLCDRAGVCVAAAHAGWRGLAAGVLVRTISRMPAPADQLLAWLGPGISQPAYQVGPELRDRFVGLDQHLDQFFRPDGGCELDRWHADLAGIARFLLFESGVSAVYGGQYCTFGDSQRFFSHRRDSPTGRQASLIWLTP